MAVAINDELFEKIRDELAKDWFAVVVFHSVANDYKATLSQLAIPIKQNQPSTLLFGSVFIGQDQEEDLCFDMKGILQNLIDKEGEDALVADVFNLHGIKASTECSNLIHELGLKYINKVLEHLRQPEEANIFLKPSTKFYILPPLVNPFTYEPPKVDSSKIFLMESGYFKGKIKCQEK